MFSQYIGIFIAKQPGVLHFKLVTNLQKYAEKNSAFRHSSRTQKAKISRQKIKFSYCISLTTTEYSYLRTQ